jgi:hypothetical protein
LTVCWTSSCRKDEPTPMTSCIVIRLTPMPMMLFQ